MKSFLLIKKKRLFSFKSRREVEEIDHFQNPYVKRSEKTATESKESCKEMKVAYVRCNLRTHYLRF